MMCLEGRRQFKQILQVFLQMSRGLGVLGGA